MLNSVGEGKEAALRSASRSLLEFLSFPCAAPGADNNLVFGRTIAPEAARRTRVSNGSTSPVLSTKSAALNSTLYSAGWLVS